MYIAAKQNRMKCSLAVIILEEFEVAWGNNMCKEGTQKQLLGTCQPCKN